MPRGVAPPGENVGVNVHTIAFWDGSRPFQNLIYGGTWEMKAADGSGSAVPAENLDANGWIRALPAGATAVRALSVPTKAAEIICRWDGDDRNSMKVSNSSGPVRSTRIGATRALRFHYESTYAGTLQPAYISYIVNSGDYVRNVVCREAGASDASVFHPTYASALRGFSVIRFMKWQSSVEANTPVTWHGRNKPGDGDFTYRDGVPVEHMVQLANDLDADPWFAMPWNADDDYVARFATYVRDNLRPGRRVYVEVGNEVWNGSYPVLKQAQQEGTAEGLDSANGEYGQAMARYAEKTQQFMRIWSRIFAGHMDRLVRVASAQNVSPFWSEQILSFHDTAGSVDALATAPYWNVGDGDVRGKPLDEIMTKLLPAKITESLYWAAKQKAVAAKYGKRYIAYEGGQHVWLNDNERLVGQIERDPRMYRLYKTYLEQWNRRIGDTHALFALTGGIGKAGFGLVEYVGQPDGETPKMRAVREFLHPRSH